jgi:hypothetical protein
LREMDGAPILDAAEFFVSFVSFSLIPILLNL